MSFESKMRKHIQQVFDENVPNPYEKVEVKKTFNLKKILMPLGLGALACAAVVALVVPLAKGFGSLKGNEKIPNYNGDALAPEDNGHGESKDIGGEGTAENPKLIEKMSICAAPKSATLNSLSSEFVQNTAVGALHAFDELYKVQKKNYVISPASYLLGAAGLCAVSDGINPHNYCLTDPLNETKMLLENWNCFSKVTNPDTGKEEVVSKIDSGILHQQVGFKYKFNDQKRNSVEDEYIATSITGLSNYRSQAQNYFQDYVKLDMSLPELGLEENCVVSYSMLKFTDNANLGPTETRYFTNGTDTITVQVCVYGDSAEHSYHTEVYENAKYVAFKRQIRNSSLLFIVPKDNVSLDEIRVSEAYAEFMTNKVDRLAYGFIPYFQTSNIGMDVSDAIKESFTGSERLYSKLLEDNVSGNSIDLKMIQNASYSFEDDGLFDANSSDYNPGENGGTNAICLNVDKPFYAICLKDDFPLFVNKIVDPRK